MKIYYYNKINEHPTQEDVGRITIFARIFGEDEIPGIDDDCGDVLRELVLYVCDLNCPLSYAMEVRIDITPNHLVEEDEEEVYEIEETVNILFRPARKDVLKSLMRKIYKKMSLKKEQDDDMGEKCVVCFEEFNNGETFVTLPCGHDFDEDMCVV
ncbi:unnamed protein product [Cochlearia groenlandica]